MVAKKARGLGKGLGALFDDMDMEVSINNGEKADERPKSKDKDLQERGLIFVDINDIKPNSKQPRKAFNDDSIEELATSIKNHGVIQPVTVRSAKNGYELVAGERRWRAARKAGLSSIPAIIKEIDDEQNIFLALIENMQREDLNIIEEAEAINEIIEKYDLTQEEVSKSLGKSRVYITNTLRLLKLPEAVRGYIFENKISGGHGKAIAAVKEEAEQKKIAKKVIEQGLSVRETERLTNEIKAPKTKTAPKPAKKRKKPGIKAVEDELTTLFSAKVTVNDEGNKGQVEISYYSKDELNEIIDLLRTIDR